MQTIVFRPCEESKIVEQNVRISNEGHILVVPVYFRRVCPCRELIVNVQIYIEGRLYAMQTKTVFTGEHCHCKRIRNFYVGEFTFLFAEECISEVGVRVLSHYIY